MTSDNECFRINTLGTYNVIDAAIKMGVKKIIFASSETTYGICFADGEVKPEYIPIDEEHPTIPEDSYAMSKVVNEATAKSFQRRKNRMQHNIDGLRIDTVRFVERDFWGDFNSFFWNSKFGGFFQFSGTEGKSTIDF